MEARSAAVAGRYVSTRLFRYVDAIAINADLVGHDAGLPSVGCQTKSANTGRQVDVGLDGIERGYAAMPLRTITTVR